MRLWLAIALLFLAVQAQAQDAPPRWDERYWNPKPAEDDLVLPLPCGGAMAFRWVATPTESNWLADRQVFVGRAAEEASYGEFAHLENLAGSLSGGDPAKRGFWLGKYEVTEAQYRAVTDEACPTPSDANRRPAADLSWFDAVAFTRKLTEWLLANAAEALPKEGGAQAFLRLPSEVEWEYAVRGGSAVSESEFRAPLFPMTAELGRYAWFQGATSCSGKPRPVGLLEANPLGLYDVLGNVEEMTLEPYRANRAGRLHGQLGGYVARGGSCLFAPEQIRSSARLEYPLFNAEKGKATTLGFVGFRVALAAPLATDAQRIEALNKDWQAALAARTFTAEDDPLAAIEEVAGELSDLQAKDALQQSLVALRAEIGARNEAEARALQSLVLAGASLGQQYLLAADRIRRMETTRAGLDELLKAQKPGSKGEEDYKKLIERLDQGIADWQPTRDMAGLTYLELLLQASGDYGRDALEEQLHLVEERLARLAAEGDPSAEGGDLLSAVARCFAAQALLQRDGRVEEPRSFLVELDWRLAGATPPDDATPPDSGCAR